jgi:hypothetical protein
VGLLMAEMNIDFAKNVVSHHLAAESIRYTLEQEAIGWEHFPEVGEYDWQQVVADAILISVSLRPHIQDVEESLLYLAERADKED